MGLSPQERFMGEGAPEMPHDNGWMGVTASNGVSRALLVGGVGLSMVCMVT